MPEPARKHDHQTGLAPSCEEDKRGWHPSWYQIAVFVIAVVQVAWIERNIQPLAFFLFPMAVAYIALGVPGKSALKRFAQFYVGAVALGVTVSAVHWLFPGIDDKSLAPVGSFRWRSERLLTWYGMVYIVSLFVVIPWLALFKIWQAEQVWQKDKSRYYDRNSALWIGIPLFMVAVLMLPGVPFILATIGFWPPIDLEAAWAVLFALLKLLGL